MCPPPRICPILISKYAPDYVYVLLCAHTWRGFGGGFLDLLFILVLLLLLLYVVFWFFIFLWVILLLLRPAPAPWIQVIYVNQGYILFILIIPPPYHHSIITERKRSGIIIFPIFFLNKFFIIYTFDVNIYCEAVWYRLIFAEPSSAYIYSLIPIPKIFWHSRLSVWPKQLIYVIHKAYMRALQAMETPPLSPFQFLHHFGNSRISRIHVTRSSQEWSLGMDYQLRNWAQYKFFVPSSPFPPPPPPHDYNNPNNIIYPCSDFETVPDLGAGLASAFLGRPRPD